jgi:hypothetical protein
MSNHTTSAAGGAMPAEGHKSRRALLRLFGAAPALAILPAAAQASWLTRSDVDPVFAAILAAGPVATVFAAQGGAAVAEDRLGSLYADLCRVHAEKNAASTMCDDETFEKLYDRHWALREAINETVATTLAGLRIKATTAELALEGDLEAECRGSGSFVDLCQSLHRDLLALSSQPEELADV